MDPRIERLELRGGLDPGRGDAAAAAAAVLLRSGGEKPTVEPRVRQKGQGGGVVDGGVRVGGVHEAAEEGAVVIVFLGGGIEVLVGGVGFQL